VQPTHGFGSFCGRPADGCRLDDRGREASNRRSPSMRTRCCVTSSAVGWPGPDPLRLGIGADPAGAVLDTAGRPSSSIFTLGPPLRGLWYETTAIPEIRDQAAVLARRLTAESQARQRPGSAA
jgi:hypothetical protein